jgi:hypothetical protein
MNRPLRHRVTLPMTSLTPPAHHAVLLRPNQLADMLEQWAFRREKVLSVLDIAGANAARDLARRCRILSVADDDDPTVDGPDGPLSIEWLEIREEVARLLQRDVANRAALAG